jgi:hypothetical protein
MFLLPIMLMACASAGDPSSGGSFQVQLDASGTTDSSLVVDGASPPPPMVDASPPPVDAPSGAGSGSGSGSGTMSGSCAFPFDGTLAIWSFAGDAGSQTSTPAQTTATGLVAGGVARSSGVKPESGIGSINSSDWATTATADGTKYYTVSVTPPAGCLMDLTLLSVDAKASTSGPGSADVATSVDGFKSSTPVATSGRNAPMLSVANAPGAVELRVYGYAALKTTGTFRIAESLTLTGVLH